MDLGYTGQCLLQLASEGWEGLPAVLLCDQLNSAVG